MSIKTFAGGVAPSMDRHGRRPASPPSSDRPVAIKLFSDISTGLGAPYLHALRVLSAVGTHSAARRAQADHEDFRPAVIGLGRRRRGPVAKGRGGVAAAQRIVPRQVMISLVWGPLFSSILPFFAARRLLRVATTAMAAVAGVDSDAGSVEFAARVLAWLPQCLRPLALTLPSCVCRAIKRWSRRPRRPNERSTSMQQSSWSSSRWCLLPLAHAQA